jgi:hypothetical protein
MQTPLTIEHLLSGQKPQLPLLDPAAFDDSHGID